MSAWDTINSIGESTVGKVINPVWSATGDLVDAGKQAIKDISGAQAAEDAAAARRKGLDAAAAEQSRQFDITQEQYKPYREAGARGLSKYEQMLASQGPQPTSTGGGSIFSSMFGSAGLTGAGTGDTTQWADNIPEAFTYTAEDFAKGQDPGYQFRADTQMTALERVMARRGQRGGGARYRGLMELSGKLASQEFSSARGRAFQDYSSGVSREAEQYQRGYLTPLSNYASLAGIGGSATQQLGNLRSNYANTMGNIATGIGNTNAAESLGKYGAYKGLVEMGIRGAGLYMSGGASALIPGGAPASGATNVYGGMQNMSSGYQNNALNTPMQFGSGVYQ